MYKLFYYLIFGKFPCEHSWIKYGSYESVFMNNLRKTLIVNRCEKCGKMREVEFRNYP